MATIPFFFPNPNPKSPIHTSPSRTPLPLLSSLSPSSPRQGRPPRPHRRLLWTTEKEQLFIVKNAVFGTETGDVLQVIDVEKGLLNNVITFPPSGVFFVRSACQAVSAQRVNFSAVLRGEGWEIPLPPFGQGWFESVYMDEDLRVAKASGEII